MKEYQMKRSTSGLAIFKAGLTMKIALVLLAGLVAAFVVQAEDQLPAPAKAKPNIIFFLSDDHGFRHSEPYGDLFVKTPNMTRLSEESMLFDHAYAPSPLCSPSRSCIATGMMPHRNGGHFFGMKVKARVRDMPDYLNELGYHTAAFGKRGYSKKGKGAGFDYVKGGSISIRLKGDEKVVADYILNYKGPEPLFMHIGVSPPHLPWVENSEYDPAKIPLPPNYVDTKEMRLAMADYYTDVSVMDSMLGTILDAINERGIAENTLLVLTSDQGPPLPFGKWCTSDGGLRVPFMVRWPGHTTKGVRTDAMINLVDLLPTFIEAGGGTVPDGLDGKSLMPVLNGTTKQHRDMVFGSHSGNKNGPEYNHNECPMRTIRTPRFRYIFNLHPDRLFNTHVRVSKVDRNVRKPYWPSWQAKAKTDDFAKRMVDAYEHRPAEELYDLSKDPFGIKNLADNPEYAAIKKKLRTQLYAWCKTQDDPEGVEGMSQGIKR